MTENAGLSERKPASSLKRRGLRGKRKQSRFQDQDEQVHKIRRAVVSTARRFAGISNAYDNTSGILETTDGGSLSAGPVLSRHASEHELEPGRVTEMVVEDRDWDQLETEIYDADRLDDQHVQVEAASSDGQNTHTHKPGSEYVPARMRNTGLALKRFLAPQFDNPDYERVFCRDAYIQKKSGTMGLAFFLVLNWALYLGVNFGLHTFDTQTLFSKICYYGIATALTIPLPVMIAYDFPIKYWLFYQLYASASVWQWSYFEFVQSRLCGFWRDHRLCYSKDFLAMTFYATALPSLALFISLSRSFVVAGAIIAMVLQAIFDLPEASLYSRVFVLLVLYWIFITVAHYYNEKRERRLFRIGVQLKAAYRAQQRAQTKESEAFASKRRFISYIFHEVRVPLNTAFIAYQNLHANRAFRLEEGDNDVEIDAMEGSLSMMSKVLDDVLDISRMDAGRFENLSQPFELHRSVQAALATIKAAAVNKHIELMIENDEAIDKLAQPGRDHVWLVGDSTRLRQLISNFASNAAKFTPDGGRIKISTKLIRTIHPHKPSSEEKVPLADIEKQTDVAQQRVRAVILFSIEDSGPGIDLATTGKLLFIPFSQTSIGKSFGSKGSGLGLAIVRQIVKLSGGRVGVRSDPSKKSGTCFWFELAFWTASSDEIADMEGMRIAPKAYGGESKAISPTLSQSRPGISRLTSYQSTMRSSQYSRGLTPTEESSPTGMHLSASRSSLGERSQSASPLPPPAAEKGKSPKWRPGPAPRRQSVARSSPLRVLVTDDDSLTRKLMTRLLERLGCIVTTAEDGQYALDILLGTPEHEPEQFDVIFLDNQMPRKSGPAVAATLRSSNRNDFICGLTGNALKDDLEDYLAAGANIVLTKPVLQPDLKRVLKTVGSRPVASELVAQ